MGLAVAIYCYYKKLSSEQKSVVSVSSRQAKTNHAVEQNVGPKIEVYYGSQTGTAEEFSKILAQEGRKYGFQMKSVDLEKFDPSKLKGSTSIFLVATYGEGDPTDNARSFHRWISETAEEGALAGMQFAVFALGNMQYEHYNSFGKLVDKECERCGGLTRPLRTRSTLWPSSLRSAEVFLLLPSPPLLPIALRRLSTHTALRGFNGALALLGRRPPRPRTRRAVAGGVAAVTAVTAVAAAGWGATGCTTSGWATTTRISRRTLRRGPTPHPLSLSHLSLPLSRSLFSLSLLSLSSLSLSLSLSLAHPHTRSQARFNLAHSHLHSATA